MTVDGHLTTTYRILVAVDDDRTLANELMDAIDQLGQSVDELSVTLLHVVRDVDVPTKVSIHQLAADYEEQMEETQELPLAVTESAARLSGTPHETGVLIESGDPAQEIIEHAESGQFDAVYIGGRKDSPVGKVLFGSVVQAVLLNTDTPVTVVGQLE